MEKETIWPRLLFYTLIVFLGAASIALYTTATVKPTVAILALAIIWVSFVPLAIFLKSELSNKSVPLLPITGIFYAVYFGLPIFTVSLIWPDTRFAESCGYSDLLIVIYTCIGIPEIKPATLTLVLTSVALFFTGYYVTTRSIGRRIPAFTLPQNVDLSHAKSLLWILLILHVAYEFLPGLHQIPSTRQLIQYFPFISFGGFILLFHQKKLSTLEIPVLLFLFLPIEIYFLIRELFITKILLFIIFLCIIVWKCKYYKFIFISSLLLLFIISTYGATTSVRPSTSNLIDRLINSAEVYAKIMFSHNLEFTNEKGASRSYPTFVIKDGTNHVYYGPFGSLAKRTAQFWVFHVVDDKSPSPIPYWQGETYKPLFTSLIPRALYPEKPIENVGELFGKRYGFLAPGDKNISINLPWITELLANFGPMGVMMGMAVFGIFFATVNRIFNSPDVRDLEFVIGISIIFQIVYPESNFSLMVGTMVPALIAFSLYFTVGIWALKRSPLSFRRNMRGQD